MRCRIVVIIVEEGHGSLNSMSFATVAAAACWIYAFLDPIAFHGKVCGKASLTVGQNLPSRGRATGKYYFWRELYSHSFICRR